MKLPMSSVPPKTAGFGKRKPRKRKRSKPSRNSSVEDQKQQSAAKPTSHPKRRKVEQASAGAGASSSSSCSSRSNKKQLPSLLDKMRMRLSGGHFRMLNEKLYTCSGTEAFDYFRSDPQLFDMYHAGYQEQMSHWPEQPVNTIIKWLKNHSSSLTVADFGCGNAILARSVKNIVFSIDLVSNDPSVIACDMSHTPLDSSSVDVAVFCLSLMGINYPSYLEEANRVLKPRGWLLIAEVKSRFDPNTQGADPEQFCNAVNKLGFSLVSKDCTNKMFLSFYFKKKDKTSQVENIDWPDLKPCMYKRR